MPEPEATSAANPFLDHPERCRTLRLALARAAHVASITMNAHTVPTRIYLHQFMGEVLALCAPADARTALRIVGWELSTVLCHMATQGGAVAELDVDPMVEACTCGRDHYKDIWASNEFISCAIRGDHAAALRTLKAVEENGGADLDQRAMEGHAHLAFLLARAADTIADMDTPPNT